MALSFWISAFARMTNYQASGCHQHQVTRYCLSLIAKTCDEVSVAEGFACYEHGRVILHVFKPQPLLAAAWKTIIYNSRSITTTPFSGTCTGTRFSPFCHAGFSLATLPSPSYTHRR